MKTLSFLLFALLLVSCGGSSTQQMNFSIPVHRATDDLQVYDGKYHGHLLDNGLTITCTIVNKSNSINYKDVKLQVLYYSKTNTVMASNNYVIYEYLNAGKLLKVKLNGTRYQSLGTLSINVIDATRY